jgi:hypothetical protein
MSTMKPNFFNLPVSRLGGFSILVARLYCPVLHKVKQCSVCLIFNMFNHQATDIISSQKIYCLDIYSGVSAQF